MARRVLLVQPSLQPPGGGNAVAAWALQALVPDHSVTVVSWQAVEVDPINRFFGTHLHQSEFSNLVVPLSSRVLADMCPLPLALLKSSILRRFARQVSDGYEVIIGVDNEADFGRRAIQYIHYPKYDRPRPTVDLRWYHDSRQVRSLYYRLADHIAGHSSQRMRDNLSLANSDWTAGHVRRLLGGEIRTLYPPVSDPAQSPATCERSRGFLAIGRISPEKEYEQLIRIVARVRRCIPDATLTIVGTYDRYTRRYFASVRRLAMEHGSMVRFLMNVSHAELRQVIASHRYGLHGMREEHFGIAPAEMVRGGCIVWVPRGGGQVEVVGNEPALVYDDEERVADEILRVDSDPNEQERLRNHLAVQGERFSTSRFVREFREIVANFVP